MLGTLVPTGGGAPIPLRKATVIIGRNPDCDVVVHCASVSGRHCELKFHDNGWTIRDLDSKNGIKVNGVRCQEQRLAPNDALALGRQRYAITFAAVEPQRSMPVGDVDIDALALQLFSEDDAPAAPPAAVAPSEPAKARDAARFGPTHAPQASTPHLHARPVLGKLVPSGGGDPIPLLQPDLVIGRHPACDICLRFPAISAKHCKMTWRDGYWFVEDLKSSNGTWIDGLRCHTKCLPPASVLGLAKHRYIAHYTAVGSPPEEEEVFAQSLLEKAGLTKHFSGRGSPERSDDKDADERVRYTLDDSP